MDCNFLNDLAFWNFISVIFSLSSSLLLIIVISGKKFFPHPAVPGGVVLFSRELPFFSLPLLVAAWEEADHYTSGTMITAFLTAVALTLRTIDAFVKPDRRVTRSIWIGFAVSLSALPLLLSDGIEHFLSAAATVIISTIIIVALLGILSLVRAFEAFEKTVDPFQQFLNDTFPWSAEMSAERRKAFDSRPIL